ncbi:MAG: monovalent cation/H+ antiporter subunit D family protein [Deltaproteobacteria bacterium]|nr:MAG: monovalent cation/H+ antiporter subunit D family protein [Deltaproteobacteria bacterium]
MILEQFPAIIVVAPLILSFVVNFVGWRNKGFCFPFVIIALSVSLVSAIGILYAVIKHGTIYYHLGGWNPPWGIEYVIDHLNAYVALIVTVIAFVVAIYSKRSIEQEIPGDRIPQLYALLLLNVTGLLGITVTGDLFNLYVLLEIASFSAYALIAIGEKGALIASFRYIVMGTIGACFYLIGVGFVYIMTGSLNMTDVGQLLPDLYYSKAILMAFTFLTIGVVIKMALFPLHAWLPDAYTHAPSAVSALIAPTMTKVGCYVLIRIIFFVFKPHYSIEIMPLTTILGWLAIIAMIVGSIYAIAQHDLKRMLAYSTVAQIGYIVMGIALANKAGLTGALLHILNEAFTKGCLFLVAGAIMYKMGMRDIYQFRYLFEKMPLTMIAFVIAAFSMVGIPPTCGFFSKLYLLLGAIDARHWIFVATLLISVVLNVVYFFNVIRHAYFKPSEAYAHDGGRPEKIAVDEVPLSMLAPIWFTAIGILITGIFSGKIVSTVIQFAIPKCFLGGG